MPGRSHRERLIKDLHEIRSELAQAVERIKPEELDWAPQPGMKSFRALLLEIGAMEKLCVQWFSKRVLENWGEAQKSLGEIGSDHRAAMEMLRSVREETLGYLNTCTEEQLQTPVAVPEEWRIYWGTEVEPEECFRWISRHEYYHLGQIISYRWILGDDPLKWG